MTTSPSIDVSPTEPGTALLEPLPAAEPASPAPPPHLPPEPETAGEETAGEETAGEETAGEETAGEEQEPGYRSAFAHILDEMDDDRRNLRWAFVAALVFHLVLLFVHLPSMIQPVEVTPAAKKKAYVVQQVRFRPPQTAPQREIPEKKRRKIPIPDPTPNDPEPVREMAVDLPDLDYDLPIGPVNLEIPDGPPGPALGEVMQVGGEIQAPVKLFAPRPGYTEEARQARIQGVVLLQVIVDTEGNVSRPQIIKGLPMGLDQLALETVKQWKFKPAEREGKPVPVYYNLTINFSLQ